MSNRPVFKGFFSNTQQSQCALYSMVSRLTVAVCAYSLVSACMTTRQPVRSTLQHHIRLAILPTLWHTRPSQQVADSQAVSITKQVRDRFEQHQNIDVIPLTNSSSCIGETSCLRQLGRKQNIRYLVATDIAELGDTAVLRMRLLDTRDVGADQIRQETLHPMGQAQVSRSIQGFVGEFGEIIAPTKKRPKTWYRQRWVWLGAVSVAVSATLAWVLVTKDNEKTPDVIITPP